MPVAAREPGRISRDVGEDRLEVDQGIEQLFDPARRCFERLQEIEVDLTFHESTFTDPRGRRGGDWRSTPLADRARALIINLSETEWGEQCLWRVMSERTGTYRRLAPLIIQAESEGAKASRIVKLCDFILASEENNYCIELVCVAVGFRDWTSQKQTVVDALLKLHKGLQDRNQRQALGGIEVLVVRIAPELAGQLAPDTAPSSATDTP